MTSFLVFLLGNGDPHSLRDKIAEVVSNKFQNLTFGKHMLLKDATQAEAVWQIEGSEPAVHAEVAAQASGCLALVETAVKEVPCLGELTPSVPAAGSMSDSLLETFAGMIDLDLRERLDGSEPDDFQCHVRTALSHPLFSSYKNTILVDVDDEGWTFGGEGDDDDPLEDVMNWYAFLSQKISEFGSVTAAVSSLATTSPSSKQEELQPHGSTENHGDVPEKIAEVGEKPVENVRKCHRLVVPKNCDRKIVMKNDRHMLFNTASWDVLSRRIREEDMNAKLLRESMQQKPKVAEPKDWKPIRKSNQEQFDLLLSGQPLPASKFELDMKTQVNKEIQREVAEEVPKSRDMREMFKKVLPTNSAEGIQATVSTATPAATEAPTATETPSATAAAAATAAPAHVESMPSATPPVAPKQKAAAKNKSNPDKNEKAQKKAKGEPENKKKTTERKRSHAALSGATAPLSEAFKKGRK